MTAADRIPSTGNPYVEAVRLFVRAQQWLNSLPFGDSSIQQANRRAAREAGYTGTRAQLNAIGQGLRSNFPTGDRPGPGPRVTYSAAPMPAPPGSTGGSVFDELLRRPVSRSPGSIFDDLIRRPPRNPAIDILAELLKRPLSWPDTRPIPDAVKRAPAAVLPRVFAVIGGLLWPSTIGKDPPWTPPPRTVKRRKGPLRRRGRKREPRTLPFPVREPPPISLPTRTTSPEPRSTPSIDPSNYPIRVPAPSPVRAPRPLPSPSPRGMPKWLTGLSPSLLPYLFSQPAPSRSARRSPAPLTRTQPRGVGSPPKDPCRCEKPAKRKRKAPCTNPIVRTTRTTRGGNRYVTITRRIECQALSRKKLPSLRAR